MARAEQDISKPARHHPDAEQGRLPRVVELDDSYLEQICSIEKRAYPSPWSDELIRGEYKKDISFRVGLILDHRLVAYSFNYLVPEDLHVLNLAVSPEYQARGLGKHLLSKLLVRALSHGVRYVSLEVRPSNAIARQLYRSMGFEIIGVRENYYPQIGDFLKVFHVVRCTSHSYGWFDLLAISHYNTPFARAFNTTSCATENPTI